MSNCVICRLQLFDKAQTITVVKDGMLEQFRVDTMDLGQEIANYCERYKVREVNLYGNANYLIETAKQIKQAEKFKYGSDTIEVSIKPV